MRTNIKYTKGLLQEAADNSNSIAGVLRYLGLRQAGGTHYHISKKLKQWDVNTDHFLGQAHLRGGSSSNKKSAGEILVTLPEESPRPKRLQLHRALQEIGVTYLCNLCKLAPEWNGKALTLEIDHINGDWLDNRQENLRYLCPNCHSQQSSTNRPNKYKSL